MGKVAFRFGALLVSGLLFGSTQAETVVEYEGSATGVAASGDFAPYYISSLNGGRFSGSYAAQAEAKAWKELDLSHRFSYGFGADLAVGYNKGIRYDRFNGTSDHWESHNLKPAAAWVQQLYGEVKYRGAYLLAGMKEQQSALLNQQLTSGNFVSSGNSRPIPEVRAGFVDFQNVPFTHGWLQIQGELSFGKMMDNGWIDDQFNYYNGHIGRDALYNYKRVYFRIGAPTNRWTITAGMQAAAMFGGKSYVYDRGKLVQERKHTVKFKNLLKIWLPISGGDDFYEGNHLGSWDFKARVRLDNGSHLSAYFEWPWEDGSGIGRLNGWDGIWGLEYEAGTSSIVSGFVAEYLDFTNQSGPIHYAPGDYPGTDLKAEATGADNYYNNNTYGSYSNYGFSIGTPAIMAPLYNTDGYPQYVANRMRGFHVGLKGEITPQLSYLVKGGYRKGYGNGRYTLPKPIDLTAVMIQAKYDIPQVPGLGVKAMIELDRGSMPCNNFGALLTVCYNGKLSWK